MVHGDDHTGRRQHARGSPAALRVRRRGARITDAGGLVVVRRLWGASGSAAGSTIERERPRALPPVAGPGFSPTKVWGFPSREGWYGSPIIGVQVWTARVLTS